MGYMNGGDAQQGFTELDNVIYSRSYIGPPSTGTPTPTPTPLQGDLNNDRTVNSLDWGIMNSQWFTGNPQSDINADGIVNSIDFGLLNRNWGLSS